MPEPSILTTGQAISAVYDWLGQPTDIVLPPSMVCSMYWLQLDLVGQRIGLSDRTFFLNKHEFTVPKNQKEKQLEDIADFGNELALESYATSGGRETTSPIPLLADFRDKDRVDRFSAYLFRPQETPTQIWVGFNYPTEAVLKCRLWWEPGGLTRPKLGERAALPQQAQSLVIINTAFACLPELLKVESGERYYEARKEVVTAQKLETTDIFDIWIKKPPTDGVAHRKAFNEARRGGRRYGGFGGGFSKRGPIIGDV